MEEQLCPREFSYEALNEYFAKTNEKLEVAGYKVKLLPGNEDFIGFSRDDLSPKPACSEGKIFERHGLKFHIGLSELNLEMRKKAWDIVIEILLRHKVEIFKVIKANCKMSDQVGQEGKDIAIYADAEPSRTAGEWRVVLEDVTNRLAREGISPGYRAPGTNEKPERPVKGTNYATYRYYNEWTKKSVWPQKDPCEKIEVSCAIQQIEITVLNRQKIVENVEKSAHTL